MAKKRNVSLEGKHREKVLNFPGNEAVTAKINKPLIVSLSRGLSDQIKTLFESAQTSKLVMEILSVSDFESLVEAVIENDQSSAESVISNYFFTLMSTCSELEKQMTLMEKENRSLKERLFVVENTLKNLDSKNSETYLSWSVAASEILKLSDGIKKAISDLEWWHANLLGEYKKQNDKISMESELVIIFCQYADEFNTQCYEDSTETKELLHLQKEVSLAVDALKLQHKECSDNWSRTRISSFEKIKSLENWSIDSCRKCNEYIKFMHEMNQSLDIKKSLKPFEVSDGLITEDDFDKAWDFSKGRGLQDLQNQTHRIADKINQVLGFEIVFDQTVKATLDLTEMNQKNTSGSKPKNKKVAEQSTTKPKISSVVDTERIYQILIAIAWIKTGNNDFKKYSTVKNLLRIATQMELLTQVESEEVYEALSKKVREEALSLTKDDFIKKTKEIWGSCESSWITCMDSYGKNKFFVRVKISEKMKNESNSIIQKLGIDQDKVVLTAKNISKERMQTFRKDFKKNE